MTVFSLPRILFNDYIILILLPAGIYLLKVNNRNTKTRCEICLKLLIKTPERRQWHCSGVFTVNFEHISHSGLVCLLLIFNRQMPAGSSIFLYPLKRLKNLWFSDVFKKYRKRPVACNVCMHVSFWCIYCCCQQVSGSKYFS